MVIDGTATLVAFEGSRRIATGQVADVAAAAHRALSANASAAVFVFNAETSVRVDLELRGSEEEVRRRYTRSPFVRPAEAPQEAQDAIERVLSGAARRSRGRPRLGVVSREVTLLPRHWEWLASRPGGASVTLRKLVDQARLGSARDDAVRLTRERTYAFMSAMAGDAPGFEEATRALFGGQRDAFLRHTDGWPHDVREHTRALATSLWADA